MTYPVINRQELIKTTKSNLSRLIEEEIKLLFNEINATARDGYNSFTILITYKETKDWVRSQGLEISEHTYYKDKYIISWLY